MIKAYYFMKPIYGLVQIHTKSIKTVIALLCLVFFQSIYAYDYNLPDLGTPSDAVMSPVKEKEIRDQIVQQIYEYNLVMSDPVVMSYIEQIGFRLAANSEKPSSSFDFFMINDNTVNASAYPGGLIIVHSGLFLRTENESELAGVIAHEIAHATQRHISRFYADAKKNTLPTILGMLGAIAASQSSNSGDAPIAILAATTAMQQQAMINYTRSNEYEADRVGINTLINAEFNPNGMAGFFEKLMRETPIDERYQMPEYNRTHPLSINRVSEAKNRAQNIQNKDFHESDLYPFLKERVRVLTKNTEIDSLSYYQKLFKEKLSADITNAEKYGYALSLYNSSDFDSALKIINQTKSTAQTMLLVAVLKAQIICELDFQSGRKQFEELYKFYPESPVVMESYIQSLSRNGSFPSREKARILARKLVLLFPENANYYSLLAISNQNLGKSIEANEALAMKEHIVNNNYRAVRILKNILKEELDYYQRAKIESKITQYEALITHSERDREIQQERESRRRN